MSVESNNELRLMMHLLTICDTTSEEKFPHLFVSYDIDRHTCHRTVPMQVLSLGMSRTGTASTKKALEILGYPTYHGFDMHSNVRDGE